MAKKKINYDELSESVGMFENKKENKQVEKKLKETKGVPENELKKEAKTELIKLIDDLFVKTNDLTFSKQVTYVSDETRNIIELVSNISNKSLRATNDIMILYFYEKNKEQLLKEYKNYQKNEKTKFL